MPSQIGGLIDRIANRFVRLAPSPRHDIAPPRPIVTFTFDDAPVSALHHGAAVLEARGVRGTYYIAGSMVDGTPAEWMPISRQGCEELAHRGHELACHTFSHRRLRDLNRRELEQDLDSNRVFLDGIAANDGPRNFATPYTMMWPPAQSTMRKRYRSARSGYPGINRLGTDLHNLRAVEIRNHSERHGGLRRWIDAVASNPGWLIFFTHEVASNPGLYGCTPDELDGLVAYAQKRGCEVLTMSTALKSLGLD